MTTLAVLLACHNRRDKTVACLRALRRSAEAAGIAYSVYLFDDGSTDGTAEAVRAIEPDVLVLHGDGSYFWNRGMHVAFARAMGNGHPAYLWLNDDTLLDTSALETLLFTLDGPGGGEAIVVGAVRDPQTQAVTYGGSRRVDPRWRPFLARMVEPTGHAEPVDVINGNVVLIPDAVARRVGNLDPGFEHAMGDTDYALRARRSGITILQSGAFVGACGRNSTKGTLRDRNAPLLRRLKDAFSRKGLPPRSWFTLCRRHGGLLWPIHFLWGYTKVVLGRSW